MNISEYNGDPRYWAVWEKMQLLGIQDISTKRQEKNGTIVWRLPIKNNNSGKTFIEVASFSTSYVRNQNSGYSNYQLNKRCQNEPEYFKDYKTTWHDDGTYTQKFTGKYRKFETRGCKLIPIEIDRLEYLISYCLKNYFIKRANQVVEGKYVSQSYHDFRVNQKVIQLQKVKRECNQAYDCGLSDGKTKASELDDRIYELESQVEVAETYSKNLEIKLAETKVRQDVSVIVNGHRYKVL